jgi:poly(A) polymerase
MPKQRDKPGPQRRPERGLRPVQDVVGRIRHDPLFDASRFTIGYEERFSGLREAPLKEFLGEGEIPWHRLWTVKAGDLIVWDRKNRIDLVFGSGDSAAPDLAAIARACAPIEAPPPPAPKRRGNHREPPVFVARPCFRFDAARDAWLPLPATGLAEVHVEALQVVTYNVLFDLYMPEKLYSERRAAECRALLATQDADIVALQEVTPGFWAALLAESWVRERYCVSDDPVAAGLVPYGQALLSRWPLALEVHSFSAQKRLVLGRMRLNGRTAAVAAVHLTSNYKMDAEDRRSEQLGVLTERLGRGDIDDAIALGDLNFGDGDENPQLAAAGLVDVWQAVHPHHPGFTFDPVANPLAAIMSKTGRASRLDRILVRSPGQRLAPIDVALIGARPFAPGPDGAGQFVSDHFGLSGLLQIDADAPVTAVVASAAVHTSALVVTPPEALCAEIQAIRAVHDPSHVRWMPHINLVYGFVPEADFPAATEAIAAALRGLPPIRVRLAGVRRFDHKGSTTVWLAPTTSPPGLLQSLQARLAARFPACDEQSTRGHDGFTPHLTIAKLTGSPGEISALVDRWSAQLQPIEFTVDAVHLISRRGGEPFAVRGSVQLGAPQPVVTPTPIAVATPRPRDQGLAPLPAWGALPTPRHAAVAAAFARACAATLGTDDPCLHIVGSARLGVAAEDADLDLVVASPAAHARDELFAGVCARLAAEAPLIAREVGAATPVLRCKFMGVSVDLQAAAVSTAALMTMTPASLAALDEASRRAALGVVDSDTLARRVGQHLELAAFQGLLRRVRAWARARQLDSGSWGLLGGFTWALLAAWAACDGADAGVPATPAALLDHFFAVYAAWPTSRPVAFGPPPPPSGRRAVWPVYTLTPPPFNSARGLTRSTLALLQSEFHRGQLVLPGAGDAGFAALIAAVDASASPRRVALQIDAEDEDAATEAIGWLDGQVLGWVLALEHAGAQVRPYPRGVREPGGLHASLNLGVDGGSSATIAGLCREFAQAFLAWHTRPPDVALTARLVSG